MTHILKLKIEHIDSLGQGVSKQDGQVYFTPKTLPGEIVSSKVVKKRKGVHFCELMTIEKNSSHRIKAECPHFENCGSCHFLHTTKENELFIKINNFKRMLTPLLDESHSIEINELISEDRFNYRNRIQLHYDCQKELIGYHAAQSKNIVPIQNCIVASPAIQGALGDLLKNKNWLNHARRLKNNHGHIELFDKNGDVLITWNKAYAQGGFSQVNPSVNAKLQQAIADIFEDSPGNILDLFGGSGNLVEKASKKSKLSVDNHPLSDLQLDLYSLESLEKFKNTHPQKFDTLILDPPRSGFTYLGDWVEHVQPQSILYVSCHAMTMIRDLKAIVDNYKVSKVFFIDFFPGSYHFEAGLLLHRRVN